jgi:PAS domain S-box-containing protein
VISANAVMTGSYDYSEMARSILIAIAASYAALDLAGRVIAARGWARAAWLTGGAIAMGIGIWAMHFKGLLAFRLPVRVDYHWPTVLVSLVGAVCVSAVALYIVSRQRMGPVRALTGSIIMGGGIAGMHYVDMAAMRLPAVIRFSPFLVTLSVSLAILFSLVALLIAFGLREQDKGTALRKIGGAVVMGAAISAVHYTGMAATTFVPSVVPPDLSHAMSISPLGNNGIAIVTFLVLGAAILTSSVDRQTRAELQRLNEGLEQHVVERTRQVTTVNEELRREIADRQRAEDALRHNENRLRLVIDTIPALVWRKLPDGSADFLNQRFREYTGLAVDEGLGEGWLKAIHPEDPASSIDEWRAAFAAGKPFEFEARLRRADGEYLWFLFRGEPLRDELGKIVKWYGTTTDIEDRKRAEEEITRQKEIFQKIFEHIPVMIAFIGKEGDVELVNPEWERTIGWTLKELREQNLDIFTEAYPDPQYRQKVLDFVAASTGQWTDLKVRVRDGRVIDAAVAVVHLSDGTSLAIGQDITERERTEAALQEAQGRLAHVTRVLDMGELAAAIAHEVNQPLAAIVTNANFCLRQLANAAPNFDKLREAISEIANDGTRASTVISRIRALLQKGAPERVALDVNQIIQEVIMLLRNEITRSRVSLRTHLAPDLPGVSGDPVQLQQVLINLIMNGIEAMHSLTDPLRELVIKSSRDHNEVFVQVQDSGTGLDPEQALHTSNHSLPLSPKVLEWDYQLAAQLSSPMAGVCGRSQILRGPGSNLLYRPNSTGCRFRSG